MLDLIHKRMPKYLCPALMSAKSFRLDRVLEMFTDYFLYLTTLSRDFNHGKRVSQLLKQTRLEPRESDIDGLCPTYSVLNQIAIRLASKFVTYVLSAEPLRISYYHPALKTFLC
jgi:hypothetical protein